MIISRDKRGRYASMADEYSSDPGVASEWVTSSFEPVETVGRVEQVAMFGPPP